jgi:hypothetical protein
MDMRRLLAEMMQEPKYDGQRQRQGNLRGMPFLWSSDCLMVELTDLMLQGVALPCVPASIVIRDRSNYLLISETQEQ